LRFFLAQYIRASDDGMSGTELWTSDGTAAGTARVRDIVPGPQGSNPVRLTEMNGKLFFGVTGGSAGQVELWMSDGTPAGALLVKDLYPNTNTFLIDQLLAVGGRLFLTTQSAYVSYQLWTSDGTPAGTQVVPEPAPAIWRGLCLTNANGRLFFKLFLRADDGQSGAELWTSDGTEAGTVLVRDINQSTLSLPLTHEAWRQLEYARTLAGTWS
jgi:ELWxxDGT repeat protein